MDAAATFEKNSNSSSFEVAVRARARVEDLRDQGRAVHITRPAAREDTFYQAWRWTSRVRALIMLSAVDGRAASQTVGRWTTPRTRSSLETPAVPFGDAVVAATRNAARVARASRTR